jgi:hypothetical protein
MKIKVYLAIAPIIFFVFCLFTGCNSGQSATDHSLKDSIAKHEETIEKGKVYEKKTIDTVLYNKLMQNMANNDTTGKWPTKMPYPLAGAIFPFHRIVAFYGNLYSKKMGILGELPKKEMLQKLKKEVANWQAADTSISVIPALHYIAVTAQGAPGKDGKHRMRMPFSQIDTIMNWANEIDGLVFLDIQVGHSSVKDEVPQLDKYLQLPQVHLGIDPEFSMKGGHRPGTVIGTVNADDINYVTGYLAELVKKYNLPPKILVVHRFTQGMVTNYKQIKTRPEVQVIMDMDGWGLQARKINTYRQYIYKEPVHYAGFKIFYKNDFREPNSRTMTPEEVLQLKPRPIYIQYQ